MASLIKVKHPNKEDFPTEFQEWYRDKPLKLAGFPKHINQTCVVVPTSAIDSPKSKFCDVNKRKVDEIHHCNTLGLVEHKSNNYGSVQLDEKFFNHKEFIEAKYLKYKPCEVGYCVLKAPRLSQKLKREFGVNRTGNLYFRNRKDKKHYKIGIAPVFFVKRG